MTLTVIGSGSDGNCYVLQNDTEALVLEAGMPIQDCLRALKFNVKKVQACLITHEHGDHAKYVKVYNNHFLVMMSKGTSEALGMDNWFGGATIIEKTKVENSEDELYSPITAGGFTITAIPAQHDAAEPLAFVIEHEEIGKLLFATDTYYLEYTIPGMTNMMVECNYSLDLLNKNVAAGLIPEKLKKRTLESHMSLATLKKMLEANDLTNVAQIILIHMSARNSDCEAFCRDIALQTGKLTIAARKGQKIELNKQPF